MATLKLGLPFYLIKQLYALFGIKLDELIQRQRIIWKEYRDERHRMGVKTQCTPSERGSGMEIVETLDVPAQNLRR